MSKQNKNKTQLMAILEILKSGYWYDKKVQAVLRPFGISHEQFNVLRILEHNHPRLFSLKEIQSRLMNQTANTTRLVEKLKQKDLVNSTYSKTNRRMLEISISKKGRVLLKRINKPLFDLASRVDSFLSNKDAELLIKILRNFRKAS